MNCGFCDKHFYKTFLKFQITSAMYYYFLAKISELLDTVLFVLRKKERQISFLHVYHHTLMVVVTWTALKYEPSVHLLVPGVVNSFIHVLMYIYYGLSAFSRMAKYLWWKKYITTLQLVSKAVFAHVGQLDRSDTTASLKIGVYQFFSWSMNDKVTILTLKLLGPVWKITFYGTSFLPLLRPRVCQISR